MFSRNKVAQKVARGTCCSVFSFDKKIHRPIVWEFLFWSAQRGRQVTPPQQTVRSVSDRVRYKRFYLMIKYRKDDANRLFFVCFFQCP